MIRGAAGMLNLGNLNLRDIILSTEAIQTTRFIINSAEHRQSVTKQQILIGLDIGCIIWTAPDYSSPEHQRPFIVEWQQTSHGLLQLCARPACHNLDYRSNYEYLSDTDAVSADCRVLTATAVMTEAALIVL